MSRYSKDTWQTLRLMEDQTVRVREDGSVARLSGGDLPPLLTVNQNSWKKLKRHGWVEIDPARHDPGEGWTVWKLSDKGWLRFKALTWSEKQP